LLRTSRAAALVPCVVCLTLSWDPAPEAVPWRCTAPGTGRTGPQSAALRSSRPPVGAPTNQPPEALRVAFAGCRRPVVRHGLFMGSPPLSLPVAGVGLCFVEPALRL